MSFIVLFIILAVLGFFTGFVGAVLRGRGVKPTSFDTTVTGKSSGFLKWGIHFSRMKGVRLSFGSTYKIPDFYKALRQGNRKAMLDALIIFGFSAAVIFTFLAVGSGLIAGGEEAGWLIIGLVTLTVIATALAHIRGCLKSRNEPPAD